MEELTQTYLQHGLCAACAGQAAYGHHIGFTRVNPPCRLCEPTVETFPHKAAENGWKAVYGPIVHEVSP